MNREKFPDLTSARFSKDSSQLGIAVAFGSLLLTLIWVFALHPLDAPDEPAHLQAIMQVRNQHILPEVHFSFSNAKYEVIGNPGDPAVVAYTSRHGFSNPFVYLPYESSQAPLYYLITGLVAMALPDDPQTILYLGRVIAALFGAGTVYFCWAATRQLAPNAPLWAAVVATLVALLPQFCFNSATVSNDSALNFFCAASFYVWFRSLRQPNYDPWMLRSGVLAGLAVITKATGVVLLPGLALLLIFRVLQDQGRDLNGLSQGDETALDMAGTRAKQPERLARAIKMTLGASISTLVICGWWFARNVLVYGEPTGSANTFQLYKAIDAQLNLLDIRLILKSLVSLWESTWGRYGWMDRMLPVWVYVLMGPFVLVLVALTIYGALKLARSRQSSKRWPFTPPARQAFWLLLVVLLALLLGYLQFNITVALQAQARYLFVALLPLMLLLTGGVYLLPKSRRSKIIALGLPIIVFALLNLAGIFLVFGQPPPR